MTNVLDTQGDWDIRPDSTSTFADLRLRPAAGDCRPDAATSPRSPPTATPSPSAGRRCRSTRTGTDCSPAPWSGSSGQTGSAYYRIVGVQRRAHAHRARPVGHRAVSDLRQPRRAVPGHHHRRLGRRDRRARPASSTRAPVLVHDADTPGVVITESDGNTRLVEGATGTQYGATDTYTVRLSQNPGGTVTITLRPLATPSLDLSSASTTAGCGPNRSPQGCTMVQVMFVATPGTSQVVNRRRQPDAHLHLDQLDGRAGRHGGGEGRHGRRRQRPAGVRRPGAAHPADPGPARPSTAATTRTRRSRSPSTTTCRCCCRARPPATRPRSAPPPPPSSKPAQVDTLVVHNEDSPANDTGTLTSDQITGLGMAGDTVLSGVPLRGGIVYADFEDLTVHLGYGNDTFTVASTHTGHDHDRRRCRQRHDQHPDHRRPHPGARPRRQRHLPRRQRRPAARLPAGAAGASTAGSAPTSPRSTTPARPDANLGALTQTHADRPGHDSARRQHRTTSSAAPRPALQGRARVPRLVHDRAHRDPGWRHDRARCASPSPPAPAPTEVQRQLQLLLFPRWPLATAAPGVSMRCGIERRLAVCARASTSGRSATATSSASAARSTRTRCTRSPLGLAALGTGAAAYDASSARRHRLLRPGDAEHRARTRRRRAQRPGHPAGDQRRPPATATTASTSPRWRTSGSREKPQFLAGDLDDVDGTLNLDFGTGRNNLLVSDEGATAGDPNVLMTDQYAAAHGRDANVAATAEIFLVGLSTGSITWRAAPWPTRPPATSPTGSGSGPAPAPTRFTVDGTHRRAGLRTTTWLNTGLGNDTAHGDADQRHRAGSDGFFVLDTQGPNDHLLNLRLLGLDLQTGDEPTAADVLGIRVNGVALDPSRYVVNTKADTIGLFDSFAPGRGRQRRGQAGSLAGAGGGREPLRPRPCAGERRVGAGPGQRRLGQPDGDRHQRHLGRRHPAQPGRGRRHRRPELPGVVRRHRDHPRAHQPASPSRRSA